jgi:hypothetical protein
MPLTHSMKTNRRKFLSTAGLTLGALSVPDLLAADPPKQPRGRKQRKQQRTFEQKLEPILSRFGYKDPVLPGVLHAVQRLLAREKNLNQFDQFVQSSLSQYKVPRRVLERLVRNWTSISPQFKERWFPKPLVTLPINLPVELKAFGAEMLKAVESKKILARGVPLDPQYASRIRRVPRISSVREAGPDLELLLTPGGEFRLFGSDFAVTAEANRIQILRPGRADRLETIAEITPTFATPSELRAVAPARLEPGVYSVRVIANGIRSNTWIAFVARPPEPPPVLESIMPSGAYPGERVVLSGRNFKENSFVVLEFLEQSGVSYAHHGQPVVRMISPGTQLEFRIPQTTWPGNYRLAIHNVGSGYSEWHTFLVRTPQYRVVFDKIRCLDESDLEWSSDDSIFCAFTATTEAEATPLAKVTSIMEGFSDGTERSFSIPDGQAFRTDGTAAPVKQFLVFTANPFEEDDSDAEAIRDSAGWLPALGGALASNIALLYGTAAAIATGIGGITVVVLAALVLFIALLSEGNNPLGQSVQTLTAVDLQTQTEPGRLDLSGQMQFRNDDDTGSYRLWYRIVRSEPDEGR